MPSRVMRAAGFLLLSFFLCPLPASPAESQPLRIVLMNLVCEDNSYRSTLAAADFTAAWQAEMSRDTRYDWVERVDLDKAQNELRLAGFGLIDRAEAIRGGRWAKAAWAVLSHLSTNNLFSIEVVDLENAEVLTGTNYTLLRRDKGPFKASPADVSRAGTELRKLLTQAEIVRKARREQTSVGLLFLGRTGLGDDTNDLQELFVQALQSGTNSDRPFHLLQFQHAEEGSDEVNLALSGLVQSDPDAWTKVADIYVWGTYDLKKRRRYDRQARVWNDEQTVDAALTIWNGREEPANLRLLFTNESSLLDVAQKLAEAAEPYLRQNHTVGEKALNLRRQISDSIVTNAVKIFRNPDYYQPLTGSRLQRWRQIAGMFGTACFFDPGNPVAREWWTRLRWDRRLGEECVSGFFFDRRRSEAWDRQVNQFGLQSVIPSPSRPPGDSVVSEYVLSAWTPFEIFRFSQYDQARHGVPRDTGGKEMTGWTKQFGGEFYERLLTTLDAPGSPKLRWDFLYSALEMNGGAFLFQDRKFRQRIIEALWDRLAPKPGDPPMEFDDAYKFALKRHFVEIGQPGREQALLSRLESLAAEASKKPVTRTVKLPRLSELERRNP